MNESNLKTVMDKQLHKYYPPYAESTNMQTKPKLFKVFVKSYGIFCNVLKAYPYDSANEVYSFFIAPFADVYTPVAAVKLEDLHSTIQFDYEGLTVRVDTLNGEFLPVSNQHNDMIEHMLTPICASLIKMKALEILRGETKGE